MERVVLSKNVESILSDLRGFSFFVFESDVAQQATKIPQSGTFVQLNQHIG
jgi:hypothetical protein